MTGCGTTTYTDPDDYRVNVPGLAIGLVLTSGDDFKARVTWARMRRITLALIEEAAPRIAFLSSAPALTFVCFPLRGESIWNGVQVRRGDFMLHGGGHLHQLAEAGTLWGMISIRSKDLATYSRTLLGRSLAPIHETEFLRPSHRVASDVLRLHREVCRLAATKQDVMAHREVARAAEQDLLHQLVNALSDARSNERNGTMCRRAEIMARFEGLLAEKTAHLSMPAISAALDVPQRTLRICCEAFLGCSPLAYAKLQRLNRARSALSRADHELESVADIARTHGFSEPGRFAVAYRALFGETPSATLLRGSAESA
jgi:AraC-like DNA-binding protein